MPTVQPLPCQTTTPVGPAPHLPAPSNSSVAVGSRKIGPTPKVKPLNVRLGEESSWSCRRSTWTREAGTGKEVVLAKHYGARIVREITYQSGLSVMGTTGWIFTNHWEPSSSVPTLPL